MPNSAHQILLLTAMFAIGWPLAALAQSNVASTNPPTMTAGQSARPADENPRVAGATGQAIVPGDRSTIAGDRRGTNEQRTGSGSGDR